MATADQPTPTTPAPGAAPVRHKDNLPKGQLELATLGVAAAAAWQASPLGDLLYKKKADFAAQAAAYHASIGTADTADDGISPAAQRLKALDKQVAKNLGFVKGYLAEDHDGEGDEAFYGEFGIVREGKNWQLPTARPARAQALGKLVAALAAHGYGPRKFGTAFWQPLATEYAQLAQASGTQRGAASAAVGAKNALEAPLRTVLRSLVLLIGAHYPDEAARKGTLRAFGFQKESY